MLALDFNPRRFSDYIVHLLFPLLAIVLPLLFLWADLPIAPLIITTDQRLFGMFSLCMWCVLLIAAVREIKTRPGISFEQGGIVLLPLLVSFFLLVLVVEYADVSWDYEQYEDAARALVQRRNPYLSEQYLYPPLFAQVMAAIHALGMKTVAPAVVGPWLFVFYIYQCVQFLLANLAYQLTGRFASALGFPAVQAKLLTAGLFLFNFPLIRTLHLNQVNLLILNATLVSLLALARFPVLSGMAIAVGGLVKLYPLVLGAPLLFMRKWRALLSGLVGGAFIVFLLTNFGRDFTHWRQFIEFMLSFPAERESSIWLRNTSILSLGRNLSRFANLPESMIVPFYIAGALIVIAWVALRLYQREKTYPTLPPGPAREAYRNFGNLIDFVNLSLLITPSAWDHHFVLALPLVVWAIALRGKDRPGWVGVAAACIFVLSPFDVFPFSYLRMFGAIVLMALTSPSVRLNLHRDDAISV
jgi:hypothetical protein